MTLVSVIVPVYNVERYLGRCVKSLLAQTYDDVEIVLVNDGSTDRSGVLCDVLAERHEHVTVVHQANGGLSDARNAGLALASGSYVLFLDSDDWIESDAIASMHQVASAESADVVVAGFFVDQEDYTGRLTSSEARLPGSASFPDSTGANSLLDLDLMNYIGYAWNKLYRRSMLEHGEKFPVGVSLVEDIAFNGPVLAKAKKVCFVNEAFVHYTQRPDDTLGSRSYANLNQLVAVATKSTEVLLAAWRVPDQRARQLLDDLEQARFRHGLLVSSRKGPRALLRTVTLAAWTLNGRRALLSVGRQLIGKVSSDQFALNMAAKARDEISSHLSRYGRYILTRLRGK